MIDLIGKADWFQRRKYGGWGISPKTWQGWVYTAILIIPFMIFQALPFWSTSTRLFVTGGWVLFLLFDVTHIMITLKRDEREEKIEAFAERNASWFMAIVLVFGVLYQTYTSAMKQSFSIDLFLVAALLGGALVKTLSNLYLEKGDL